MQLQHQQDANIEKLDRKTDREWRRLSNQVLYFRCQKKNCHTNPRLLSIATSEPQSPIAPVLHLWRADNFAQSGQFVNAIKSYDQTVRASQSARIFLPNQDLIRGALVHKAQSFVLLGDLNNGLATYHELLNYQPSNKEAALQAGILAERLGNNEMAHKYYQRITCADYSMDADDPAQLAKRAIDRLKAPDAVFYQSQQELVGILKVAVECKDTSQLSRMVSKTHFAIGPVGGETGFEDLELVDIFLKDLVSANVRVKPHLAGNGSKRYLTLTGFKGRFRGHVSLIITRAPRGWQWTGIALHSPNKFWLERWTAKVHETNDPLPFNDLRAPWPRGTCFTAGGILEYTFVHSLI